MIGKALGRILSYMEMNKPKAEVLMVAGHLTQLVNLHTGMLSSELLPAYYRFTSRLSVLRAAIRKHYPEKRDLLIELTEKLIEIQKVSTQAILGRASESSLKEKARAFDRLAEENGIKATLDDLKEDFCQIAFIENLIEVHKALEEAAKVLHKK